MQRYYNEKQKFSSNIIYAGIIMLIGALLISFIFYIIPFQFTIIYAVIEICLFFTLFKYVAKKFDLHDLRYTTTIGVIPGIILFFLPHLLDYNYLQSYAASLGHTLTVIDYLKIYLGQESYIIGYGIRKSNSFFNAIFEIIKFLIIIIGSIVLSLNVGEIPYSTLKKSHYKKSFSIEYNRYKQDFLNNLNENNFNTIITAFFNDKRRFENITQKNDFILYELEGDPKKILEINYKYYSLNKEEYTLIKRFINNFAQLNKGSPSSCLDTNQGLHTTPKK